ncbi:MAG: alpha/beta fold hydrolase [Paracoccaceae bacterium]|nr:alpha/beta fold hydrolase [Paracoccaceae bacterium]
MPEPRPPVLLIHGAWQGSWVWESQVPALAAAGYSPIALDLPGNGVDGRDPREVTFEDHLAFAGAAMPSDRGPVAIVAHSGGGVLATALAEAHPQRVAQIVYVAGMMLPSGVTFPEFCAPFVAADTAALGIAAHLEDLGGATGVPKAAAMEVFYHDCTPAAANAAAARLTPQGEAVRAPRVHWTPAGAGRIPRAYIRCDADRSVLPEVQDAMVAAWPGARLHRLGCGHAPMLAAPDELGDALLALLRLAASAPSPNA